MKFICSILLTFLFVNVAKGQTKTDTINTLQEKTKIYLTEMYVRKQFEKASKMWDSRMYLEMEDFYNKRKQGQIKDSALHNRIKLDINKYYKKLVKFRFDKFLKSSLEKDNDFTFGYIFFEYTEIFKNKSEKVKTMLVFISENNGKDWVLQDWKVKDIADKVDKKIIY